ncbi:hypothetical protein FB45DRAFT_869397 [Roridomyces roridus]|uniref:Uncharacterized protein n=1 Tax=Roridomyces roridus TaxID=1738132 RepID=A0AAD7FHI9_9AGAR|nr:hypothetical protein FB45DRAFT_869397 [Roridomyces roridus]
MDWGRVQGEVSVQQFNEGEVGRRTGWLALPSEASSSPWSASYSPFVRLQIYVWDVPEPGFPEMGCIKYTAHWLSSYSVCVPARSGPGCTKKTLNSVLDNRTYSATLHARLRAIPRKDLNSALAELNSGSNPGFLASEMTTVPGSGAGAVPVQWSSECHNVLRRPTLGGSRGREIVTHTGRRTKNGKSTLITAGRFLGSLDAAPAEVLRCTTDASESESLTAGLQATIIPDNIWSLEAVSFSLSHLQRSHRTPHRLHNACVSLRGQEIPWNGTPAVPRFTRIVVQPIYTDNPQGFSSKVRAAIWVNPRGVSIGVGVEFFPSARGGSGLPLPHCSAPVGAGTGCTGIQEDGSWQREIGSESRHMSHVAKADSIRNASVWFMAQRSASALVIVQNRERELREMKSRKRTLPVLGTPKIVLPSREPHGIASRRSIPPETKHERGFPSQSKFHLLTMDEYRINSNSKCDRFGFLDSIHSHLVHPNTFISELDSVRHFTSLQPRDESALRLVSAPHCVTIECQSRIQTVNYVSQLQRPETENPLNECTGRHNGRVECDGWSRLDNGCAGMASALDGEDESGDRTKNSTCGGGGGSATARNLDIYRLDKIQDCRTGFVVYIAATNLRTVKGTSWVTPWETELRRAELERRKGEIEPDCCCGVSAFDIKAVQYSTKATHEISRQHPPTPPRRTRWYTDWLLITSGLYRRSKVWRKANGLALGKKQNRDDSMPGLRLKAEENVNWPRAPGVECQSSFGRRRRRQKRRIATRKNPPRDWVRGCVEAGDSSLRGGQTLRGFCPLVTAVRGDGHLFEASILWTLRGYNKIEYRCSRVHTTASHPTNCRRWPAAMRYRHLPRDRSHRAISGDEEHLGGMLWRVPAHKSFTQTAVGAEIVVYAACEGGYVGHCAIVTVVVKGEYCRLIAGI